MSHKGVGESGNSLPGRKLGGVLEIKEELINRLRE